MGLPMPWERFSDSESHLRRSQKGSGWSMRVRYRIEYMVRNENAAEDGLALIRWMNAEQDDSEITE